LPLITGNTMEDGMSRMDQVRYCSLKCMSRHNPTAFSNLACFCGTAYRRR
jgi:hypothetical protein